MRRAVLRALLVLLVVVVADAAWVGARALRARSHLDRARGTLLQAQTALLAGRATEASALLRTASRDTAAARGLTSDPVWHLDAHLPVLGSSLGTATVVAAQADALATALPPLVGVASDLASGALLQGDRVDLARLETARQAGDDGGRLLERVRTALQAAPADPLVGAVGLARRELLDQVVRAQARLDPAQSALRLLPGMLGGQGRRLYFVALQNTAEARGTGGLIGTWALVQADSGRVSLVRAGSDAELQPPFPRPVTEVSPDFTRRWRPFQADTDWRNAGASPHFPWTAQVLRAMWQQRFGQHLDGVIALDPTAAGYVLSTSGPARLPDGSTISGDGLSTFVESTLYDRFPTTAQAPARQGLLSRLVTQVFSDLTHPRDPRALIAALGRGVSERRLLLESGIPAEQALLESTGVAGVLSDAPGPFTGVVVHNAIGNKMDFYLDRTLRWTARGCPPSGASRTVTTELTLHDDAPSRRLPPYVSAAAAPSQSGRPAGSNRSWVSVYGSLGATATSARLDGRDVAVVTQTERGHPVVALYVDLDPGQRRRLVVTWADPATGPPAAPLLQPLVRPASVQVDLPACG